MARRPAMIQYAVRKPGIPVWLSQRAGFGLFTPMSGGGLMSSHQDLRVLRPGNLKADPSARLWYRSSWHRLFSTRTGVSMDISLATTRFDPYRALGLDPSTPFDTIQGAYRILARRLHPDISGDPSTAEAMQRANIAYDAIRAERMGQAAPPDFTLSPTPVLRRSIQGFDPMALYRQAMTTEWRTSGQMVDIRA
jgi:hypothetical protein